MGEKSIRDDLMEAFDDHDEQEELEEEGGSEEDTEEPLGDTESAEGEDSSDDGEEDDEGSDSDEPVADIEPPKAKGKPAEIKKGPGEKLPGEASEVAKPPVSWKPAAKEVWNKLPKEAQEEVLRREREIEHYHNSTKYERQLASQFIETVRPFEPLIASQNSTPLQAVRNLMTTAAGLTLGTSVQKAQIIGNIISQYGVDIQALDDVLSGEVEPERQQEHNLALMLEQKLAPIQGFIQEIHGARQTYEQRQQQNTQTQIEQFASTHDFFEDVREDMADLMEMNAKRGVEMSMEDAYAKAVSLNPELSKIVTRRQKMEAAKKNGSTVRRKRDAASSIRGAPGGKSGSKSESLRGALEEAWDEASG